MDIIWKLRSYLRQFAKRYLLAMLVLQVVALLNLIPFYLIGQIVDEMVKETLTGQTFALYMGGIIGSALLMYGLRFVWQRQLYGAAIGIAKVMRQDLFAKYTRLPPAFYSQRSTGDLMAHATNDLNAVEEAMGMGIMTLVDSFIAGLTVIFGMIFVVSGELTLVSLLPFPLLVLITRKYGILLHQRFGTAQAMFSVLNEEVRESVAGIRDVRSHGIEDRQNQRFAANLEKTLTANLGVARVEAAFSPTVQLVYGSAFVIALGYGTWMIDQGELSVGLFTTFTLYMTQLLGPFLQLGWQFNVFQRGSTSWARLEKLFSEPETIVEGEQTLATGKHDLSLDIRHFRYPNSQHPALENIHLQLPKGGFLGITGPTGAGKSSLLHLLLRQFPLELDSQICLGNQRIENLTFDSLRRQYAWVPQKPFLFSASIADNIALGKPTASREQIQWAAQMAGIFDEIQALPQGFDTQLSENGGNLSGGQRQRLTLARALLTDAPILLLDDPFSALDMKTEAQVRQNLAEHFADRTIILITQRLSNLRHADEILVLEQGQILERGDHQQLLATPNWYAKVYQRQQSHAQQNDAVDAAEPCL